MQEINSNFRLLIANLENLPDTFLLLTAFFPIVFLPQETLDLTCRKAPCFVKFSEMEKMANIQAEINEVQPLLLSVYTCHFNT